MVFVGQSKADKTTQVQAKLGQPAPDFTLVDQDGKSHNLSDFAGKVVVLEWFNEQCPFVVKHYSKSGNMNRIANAYAEKGVVWLAINSTSGTGVEHNKKVAGTPGWELNRPLLDDSSGKVGRLYGATRTPEMFIINAEGVIVYHGAIDSNSSSDPATIEGATNYVVQALDQILAGESVSDPQTKPHGCTVKYAK
jgi:peroxiredoxin